MSAEKAQAGAHQEKTIRHVQLVFRWTESRTVAEIYLIKGGTGDDTYSSADCHNEKEGNIEDHELFIWQDTMVNIKLFDVLENSFNREKVD